MSHDFVFANGVLKTILTYLSASPDDLSCWHCQGRVPA